MRDGQEREERPVTAAQVQTKISDAPKHSTETPGMSDLEKLVLSFAAVTEPGDLAAGFLPDGSIYLLERVADGVYTEPGDEGSAARFLVGTGGS